MTTIDLGDLRTGAVLGRGGQAEVIAAATSSGESFAFKRYHAQQLANGEQVRRKLTSMLAHPPADPTASYGHTSIAWPRHLVVASGDVVGFLMDTLGEPHLTIPDVRDEAGRSAASVSFKWGQLLTCARNLCSAVAALHDVGAAWGDLNEGNIAIYPDGLVTLLDIDACAWRNDGDYFESAGVGVEEFMAPERFLSDAAVTPEGDCWALAVAVHLILMEGFHPFLFVPPDLDRSPSMEERVTGGMSPLLNNELVAPLLAPAIDTLPPNLLDAMRGTFGRGRGDPLSRTTALQWVEALDTARQRIKTCSTGHEFGGHLDACPWCDLDARRHARRTGNQVRLDPDKRADLAGSAPPFIQPPPASSTPDLDTGEPAAGPIAPSDGPAPASPWRWWGLAFVTAVVALVGSVALTQQTFDARSFVFPLVSIGFLAVFHSEAEHPTGPGLFHLAGLGASVALLLDVVPSSWMHGDRIAIAAILPVLGHLMATGMNTLRAKRHARRRRIRGTIE